jgi:hypothetical protein
VAQQVWHKKHPSLFKISDGFLGGNIYVVFGDNVFEESVGIPICITCTSLLADVFLYSYEAEFVQKLLRENKKKMAVSFKHTFRYIDGVLSINKHNFHRMSA